MNANYPRLPMLLATAVVACLPAAASAETMMVALEFGLGDAPTLDQLEDGAGKIVIGDKEFTDFSYTPSPAAPDSSEITVSGYEDTDGEIGLVFNTFGFSAGLFGPSEIDGSLRFTVNILDPNYIFYSASLSAVSGVPTSFNNSGIVAIDELIVGEPGTVGETDFNLITEDIVLNGQQGPQDNFDEIVFPEDSRFTTLTITKDLLVAAGELNNGTMMPPDDFDRARLTTFTQGFKQRVIPEPSALGLVGLMAAVRLGFRGRRRG